MFPKIRYAVGEVGKHYDDKNWWYQRFVCRVVAPVQQHLADDGIDVMTEDWDNLLVLDACRTDAFEEAIGTDRFDDYRVVRSRGSATPEWVEANFAGGEFGDTVYVTSNPWVSKKAPNAFHAIEDIWHEEYGVGDDAVGDGEALTANDNFDFEDTIPADRVTQRAVEAAAEYPDKRLIVHYFQPHAPYVGLPDGTLRDDIPTFHPGDDLKWGTVDRETIWTAYCENLEYVWHHTSELAEELDGRTVVTSDHGEGLGEWLRPFPVRGYDHPIGLRSPELVEVPWAVIDGDRREITSGDLTATDADEEAIAERLEDLGYRQ